MFVAHAVNAVFSVSYEFLLWPCLWLWAFLQAYTALLKGGHVLGVPSGSKRFQTCLRMQGTRMQEERCWDLASCLDLELDLAYRLAHLLLCLAQFTAARARL